MGEKNDLLSAVASDDVVDRVEHLVEYLSCKVFGQAIYRHVTFMALIGFINLEQNKIIAYSEAKACVDLKRSTAMSAKHKSLITGSVIVGGL